MKKVFKRIFQILLGISLLLLISGVVITFFFSDAIEEKVVSEIQQQITSELQLGDVNFSFYETFLSASVKITDLLAFEKEGFDNDTLFYAKTTYVELNIFGIILNTIKIKKAVISDGQLNIKYDDENKPNFAIFKTYEENKNQITLNQILVLNTSVKYQKNSVDIDWHTSKAFLLFKENNLAINAKLFSEQLEVNERDYIHEKNVQLHATLSFKKDSIFIQEGSIIHIEGIEVKLSGGVFYGNMLDLNFSCNTQKLASVINHTPEHLKAIYDSFQTTNGKLTCKGNVNGLISKTSSPALNMNYHIENGNFILKSRPFILKNINLDGEITNGENRNFISTKIEISQFDAKTENGYIKGNFTIKNLNQYHLIANLSSSWDLSETNRYFEDSTFFNLQGRAVANTQYAGYVSFDNKFKDYFINAQHTSNVTFKNITFKYKKFPLAFNFQTADCKFKNNTIEVENSSFTISDSDLNFNGDITDLIAYLLNKKDNINITGHLNSAYIKFDELLTIKDFSESKSAGIMPNWINVNLNTNITTFSYNEFIASDITGKLAYNNLTLRGEDLLLNSLNGNIVGDFKFYESNNKLKLFSNINLKQLNIRNTFLAFDNFKQDFITAEHIKGIGTAEIQMEASWKPGFIFEKKELKVKSHLIIEKGELIQFKPLESLSDYVSLDDLKKVQFSTLENTIEIDNNIINIPTMEIKSSALSVFLSGTHTFEQKIDYSIKLLLSELLSNTFRKKNTAINNEFGEVDEGGKIFTAVYFKMTGNSEDPEISLDPTRFIENVQELVKKEGEKITTIIKEDILKTKNPEKIEQGKDLIIEWEDENKYIPK